MRHRNNLGTIINSIVNQGRKTIQPLITLSARPSRRIIRRHNLVGQDRRIRSNTICLGRENRRHRCPMRPAIERCFDGASALVGDVGALKLRGTGIHRAVDEGDSHPLTRIPLRPSSIQMIIREILLRRNHIIRPGRHRHQHESTNSQRQDGSGGGKDARSAPRPPRNQTGRAGWVGRENMHGVHHWRGSHPSSTRLAGVML